MHVRCHHEMSVSLSLKAIIIFYKACVLTQKCILVAIREKASQKLLSYTKRVSQTDTQDQWEAFQNTNMDM